MSAPAIPTTAARAAVESFREGVEGARVTVVGGARSGLAAARLLARRGARVFLTDASPLAPEAQAELRASGVACEGGGHTDRALQADLVVLSPGVPSTAPLVRDAIAGGLPVVSEIEAASWFCRGPIVAVTGSNGKTTTTSLIAHVFATAGRKHVVAGNIGTAFSDYVDEIDEGTAVILEVSSFQLDHVVTFRPHVAVLLNVTPDHLDRYGGSFERYAAAKYRLFEAAQRPGDWLVYNKDDAHVAAHVEAWAAREGVTPVPFSVDEPLALGAYVRHAGDGHAGGDVITLSLPGRGSGSAAPSAPEAFDPPAASGAPGLMPLAPEAAPDSGAGADAPRGVSPDSPLGAPTPEADPAPGPAPEAARAAPWATLRPTDPLLPDEALMPTSDLALRGRHNLYNSLAAAVVARAVEIRSDVVRQSLTSFEGVPHRLERVRTVRGIAYVNDSKATNVNAVWYALESFPTHDDGRPSVVLIAGGRDKGNDYGPLRRLVSEKVLGIVAIGEGARKVLDELGELVEHTAEAHSMEEAIQFATMMAAEGDTVLLSPACSSFDMFDNYEHRGDAFKRAVQSL